MKVKIYWNLHKRVFSIQHKGRVIGHADRLLLENVEFRVSETVRQKVIRERKKYVHAYAVGDLSYAELRDHVTHGSDEAVRDAATTTIAMGKTLSYNPYKGPTFYAKESGEAVHKATRLYAFATELVPFMYGCPV